MAGLPTPGAVEGIAVVTLRCHVLPKPPAITIHELKEVYFVDCFGERIPLRVKS